MPPWCSLAAPRASTAACRASAARYTCAMIRALTASLALTLTACATTPAPLPQDAFFARLTALCGQAFAGRMVSNEAADADMTGKPMVMHVTSCSPTQIRIPFHVGPAPGGGDWDRSRTWVITRTASGLRLKHDHRHADGTSDAVTMYGGDTATPGTATRQSFPVDGESIALFRAQNLPRSVTNVWTVEADGGGFAYELRRSGQNARFFRVEFDLARPVTPPPPAWGS
jgi:hypothetical protein